MSLTYVKKYGIIIL